MFQFEYLPNGCPLCGNKGGIPHHTADFPQGRVAWVSCPFDRLIYQNPRLSDPSIRRLFDSNDYIEAGRSDSPLGYYSYFESEKSRLAMGRRKIRKIESRLDAKPLEILEIGCATGSFLKASKDRGHRVRGIDASTIFAEYGRRHYGLEIEIGLFENVSFPKSSFDAVVILGSLVCLSNPLQVFARIRTLLKPGGLVLFNVPLMDSWTARLLGKKLWVYGPGAQVLYEKASVKKLLERSGFSLLEIKRDIQAVSLEKLALVSGFLSMGHLLGPLRKSYMTLPLPSVFEFTAGYQPENPFEPYVDSAS